MFYLLPTAVSTRTVTSSSLAVMTVPANSGTLPLETSFTPSKGIKTPFIAWPSMSLLVTKYVLALLIILQKFGVPSQESKLLLSLGIQEKLLPYHLILMAFWSEQAPWIAQPNSGTLKWEKFIRLSKATKESWYLCISTLMVI
jgi:hypothetical protein